MNKVVILILLVLGIVSCKENRVIDISSRVKIEKSEIHTIPISYVVEEIHILETSKKKKNIDIGLSLKIRITNNSDSIQKVQLFDAKDILSGNIVGEYDKGKELISFVNNFEEPFIELKPNQEYIYKCTSVLFCYEDLFDNNIDYQEAMIKLLLRMRFKYIKNIERDNDVVEIGIDKNLKVLSID